jgi:NitT/TauT family transport system substrate-binding protein
MSTSRRLPAVMLAAAFVFGACGAAATPTPAPTQAPTAAPSGAATEAPTQEPDGTLPAPEKTSVTLATGVGEISQFGAALAGIMGYYDKHGVKVNVVRFNSGGDAMQAVLAGQADVISNGGADQPITTQMAGSPVQMLSVFKSHIFDGIFCRSEIKTPEDAKGKIWAVSTLGSSPHASILVALPLLGLTSSDIQIQTVGGNSVRLAALKAGSVDCVPASVEDTKLLLDLGFNELIDISKQEDARYPAPGLMAPPEFIAANPNTILAILAAQLEAQQLMVNDQATTAAKWAEFAQIDPAEAEKSAKVVTGFLDPCMMWKDEWMGFPREVLAITNPTVANADLASTGDHAPQQRLVGLGFYKKIGAPDALGPSCEPQPLDLGL